MSEVFFGINKAGQLYVDATVDACITSSNRSVKEGSIETAQVLYKNI